MQLSRAPCACEAPAQGLSGDPSQAGEGCALPDNDSALVQTRIFSLRNFRTEFVEIPIFCHLIH